MVKSSGIENKDHRTTQECRFTRENYSERDANRYEKALQQN